MLLWLSWLARLGLKREPNTPIELARQPGRQTHPYNTKLGILVLFRLPACSGLFGQPCICMDCLFRLLFQYPRQMLCTLHALSTKPSQLPQPQRNYSLLHCLCVACLWSMSVRGGRRHGDGTVWKEHEEDHNIPCSLWSPGEGRGADIRTACRTRAAMETDADTPVAASAWQSIFKNHSDLEEKNWMPGVRTVFLWDTFCQMKTRIP